jgi:hypothetical protein
MATTMNFGNYQAALAATLDIPAVINPVELYNKPGTPDLWWPETQLIEEGNTAQAESEQTHHAFVPFVAR